MNEVKRPRKPLLFYYCLVLILLLLFNWFILPQASQSQIKDTDYGTFMTMTEKGQVDSVEIQQHQLTIDAHDVIIPGIISRIGFILHGTGKSIQQLLIWCLFLLFTGSL